jgi:putative addiction module CopG family antidote
MVLANFANPAAIR